MTSLRSWRVWLLLDEAQFVKNHRAKTYQCARRIAAPFKLATGTPLENSLMDLWALLSITAPGSSHPDRFSEYYRRPIERNMDATDCVSCAADPPDAAPHQGERRIRAAQAGAGRRGRAAPDTGGSTRRICSANGRRSLG